MSTDAAPLLPNATADLARFAAALRYEDIPASVIDHAKTCLLDGIGVCLHGATLPWTRLLHATLLAEGGAPRASLWGTGAKGAWAQAALANGTAGHAFEMDDIHKESVLHPNSLTSPIALGHAEQRGATGRELLAAIVAGYECGTRVGNAATTALFLNGFHPQGTSGTIVAAATAGRLLGLDAKGMQHAFGIAGSCAAGLMAAQEGAMVKRLHAGRAAESGVRAAELASRGFTGISDIFEAPYGGFLSALSRTPKPEKLTAGLGSVWETANTGFKMYPTVTSIHAALDSLRLLMRQHALGAQDIARIEVGIGHMTHVHCAWTYKPAGITAAQMNLFYNLAVTALAGQVTVAAFTEDRLAAPEIMAFIPRIHAFEDAGLEAMGPAFRHACRMTVVTRDGRRLAHEELHRRASPEKPVTAEEVEDKFRSNLDGILTRAEQDLIVGTVAAFETADLAPMLALLGAKR